MTEVTGKKKKDSIKIILIVVIILLAGASATKIYLDHEEKNAIQAEYDATRERLSTKLDSLSTELSERISEIAQLGGDIDSLVAVKDSITAQRDQLRLTRAANKRLIARLDGKVSGYEDLLVAKDKEIEELKVINSQLLEENTELKEEQNTLSRTLTEAEKKQEELRQQINLAAKLRAENIEFFNINSRGREREGDFRQRQAQKIKVTFNLAENDVAPITGHQIMIQVLDPDGTVIFDVSRGSGTFQIQGKEQYYTAAQEIVFDNSKQALTFVYDKGSDFDKGDHRVILWADSYEIGSVRFNVR